MTSSFVTFSVFRRFCNVSLLSTFFSHLNGAPVLSTFFFFRVIPVTCFLSSFPSRSTSCLPRHFFSGFLWIISLGLIMSSFSSFLTVLYRDSLFSPEQLFFSFQSLTPILIFHHVFWPLLKTDYFLKLQSPRSSLLIWGWIWITVKKPGRQECCWVIRILSRRDEHPTGAGWGVGRSEEPGDGEGGTFFCLRWGLEWGRWSEKTK